MGLHMMTHVHLLLLLCSSLSTAAPASKSLVVLVRSPVLEQLGRETTLPCWLNPPQSAEALEIRWYRNDRFDIPIILYQNEKMTATKDASYEGRVSFGLKDAASGGLAAGDVSLKLLNVGIEDEGEYICYVSSDQGYDRGSVSLKVTETGTTPLLSMVWAEENLVKLSCGSEGWYPRPKLQWADQKQNLTPKSLEYSNVSSGLVSVHSWVLVPRSSEVSCSVGLSDVDMKEAILQLDIPPPPAKQVVQSAPGLVAVLVIFILLFLAALAVLGWPYIKKRVLPKKDKLDGSQAAENMKLLPEVEPTALEEAKKHYVNIELEDKGNPYVTIKDGIFRDSNHCDVTAVTCLTAIRGTPGFTSGQHYWEVSLESPNLKVKQSWWVGVTKATDFPLQGDAPSSTSNGFWFLSSSPERAGSFQLNTEPKVLLPVRSRPRTVGVYLNYDGGELSFYNVEDESVIGSVTATFQGEVFPFFNPGKGDRVPMEILKRTEQGACNDTGNNERAQKPESY
ncbi:butyrophilin subfamily 1 member A1-like isoform X2 [Platichthys flesus]|uniref:butyrophilin subfamily 1 member A1-like isoform X2 n=1 Tax=Platichthys flesus TaxID=8260 RepID=UPI002DBF6BCB|nr:butyrophilin subfamily 1 member A1-like isoform X2 [Platichthys flesus]